MKKLLIVSNFFKPGFRAGGPIKSIDLVCKNLKDDFMPYYILEYEYTTDCLSIKFNYNKTFYSDGNLEPDQTLSFLIRIIPFTELGVANVQNLISN